MKMRERVKLKMIEHLRRNGYANSFPTGSQHYQLLLIKELEAEGKIKRYFGSPFGSGFFYVDWELTQSGIESLGIREPIESNLCIIGWAEGSDIKPHPKSYQVILSKSKENIDGDPDYDGVEKDFEWVIKIDTLEEFMNFVWFCRDKGIKVGVSKPWLWSNPEITMFLTDSV
jgi:hypothetical protein